MSEVPDDLMKVARAAFMLACEQPSHEKRVRVIAKALSAERKRCALIADDPTRNVMWTPREIAAAILARP